MRPGSAGSDGSASAEYLGLAGLIALILVAAIATLVAEPPTRGERELGEMLARRIACSGRYPVRCGRNPLGVAYGLPLGKLVRSLAPAPSSLGGELPVDFRYCRSRSCALPGSRAGLTASGRRATAFTRVADRRRSSGTVLVTYWLYRPGMRWQRIDRTARSADVAAASGLRLSLEDVPALVPLETLPGRDHYRFPALERPPWQWLI